jgi:hypothetical protein
LDGRKFGGPESVLRDCCSRPFLTLLHCRAFARILYFFPGCVKNNPKPGELDFADQNTRNRSARERKKK